MIIAALLSCLIASNATAEIRWQTSPPTVLQSARESGKPILVFVGTDWCHYCTQMKQQTWANPNVSSAVSQQFETLMLDGDRDREIVERLGLQGYPATLLYTQDGRYVTEQNGFLPATQAMDWLESARP